MSRQILSRSDRVAQMTKQEELIAKKRLEILEKQKTVELGKAVAAAQSGGANASNNKKSETSPSEPPTPTVVASTSSAVSIVPAEMMAKFQNSFCNDGSFLTHFKKILEETKKTEEAAVEKIEDPPVIQETPEVDEGVSEATQSSPVTPPDDTSEKPQQLPATNHQQPPVINHQQPLPINHQQPPPINHQQPPPVNHSQPAPTNLLQPPPPPPPVTEQLPPSVSHPPPPVSRPHLSVSHPPPPHALTNRPPPPVSIPSRPPPPYTNMGRPMPNMPPPFSAPPSAPFFNPCVPPITAFTSIITPPPPPPPSTPLYLIPPPDPLQLNKIPPPKDLDLNAIPNPEMKLDTIRVPSEFQQHHHPPSLAHNTQSQQHEPQQKDSNEQFLPTSLESLVKLVAEKGDAYEDQIRSRKNDVHSSLWFIFEVESMAYRNYRAMVESFRQNQISNQTENISSNRDDDLNSNKSSSNDEKYDPESVIENTEDSDDEYMKDILGKNLSNIKRKIEESREDSDGSGDEQKAERNRKRKSRWGGKAHPAETAITAMVQTSFANQNKPVLSTIQRTDPALLQYARQNYGTINLTEEDWRKCEDHFKINLLYQDMMRKRKEIDQLAKSGKFKYEYDSDEDTSGGTWEHKLRTAEMEATQAWADALTAQSEGKHHIGDFLPPEELKKFMEKYDAKKNNRTPDLSDYKEYKLTEDNIGFQMLQKLGWKEGQGLGAGGTGIVDPVNKAPQRDANQGLGAGTPSTPEDCDNEYEAYRKRMMLAYRFRPNPLNNPRRAYY